eukprot:TRINITY_DN2384_c0_g1_i2.p1 TRINITY_DN2384_c0_g1~~TRINITY_DN2384_c0_g1_i2.p1  ORF type:complete len:289 (+),score=95.08 TRINITY_DN2384_c0_g1_i2:57-923(+)
MQDFTPTKVLVHPVVLLSIVDHFHRVAESEEQRVVGVLLGNVSVDGVVDVSNSYAVPFSEDPQDHAIWYLDHDYVKTMFDMFRKVSRKEEIVGWYSSGTRLSPNDYVINNLIKQYCSHPIYVLVEISRTTDFPARCFHCVKRSPQPGDVPVDTFLSLPSEKRESISEEIGVQHLLRDVRRTGQYPLQKTLGMKVRAAEALVEHLVDIVNYLESDEKKNPEILGLLQQALSSRPADDDTEVQESMASITNESYSTLLSASMTRLVVALYDVIKNRLDEKEEFSKNSSNQ